MSDQTLFLSSSESSMHFGMLLYPGMTLLDLAGPQAVLGVHGKTYLVAGSLNPVPTDTGVAVMPDTLFADCPADLDVLFVPGGIGSNGALLDRDAMAFLVDRGSRARYVTAVCTGTILLAAAGLLDGYKAATHWAYYDQLAVTSTVEPVHQRVVVDRNRITGGGVTAGLDFGLSLLDILSGSEVAKLTQLLLEYDPAPPFNAGIPELAGPEVTAIARSIAQENLDRGIAISRTLHAARIAVAGAPQ